MKTIRHLSTVLILILLSSFGFSQDIEFSASTGGIKKAGITDRFQITYTVNQRGQLSLPNYKNFKVVGGVSQGTSNSVVRDHTGKVTVQTTYTYEVILQPTKLGTHEIEGAKIKVGNATYECKPLTMEVVEESQARQQQRAQDPFEQIRKMQEEMMRGFPGRGQPQRPVEITDKDFFGRINVSKLNPYQNEQFLITYKLYTKNFNFGLEDYDFPTQEGFWSENVEVPDANKPKIETIDGLDYQVFTVKKEILSAQRAGKLTLNPFNLKARIQTSPFSAPVSKTIKSNSPVIDVKPLPNDAPASFTNQVGDLTMKIDFNGDSVKVDQPIDLKLTISGKGNLKQLSELKLNFPESFEVYDPETKNNISINDGGARGSKTFNYLLIPRKTGVFNIDPIQFTYFDLNSKSYKTISSKSFKVNAYGEDGQIAEEVISENTDLAVKEDAKEENSFSLWYWVIPLLLLVSGGLYFFILKRKSKEETEEERRKNARKKLAMKMAVAKQHLDNNNIAGFYDETLIGLNKYVNEKLQIETAKMTKESISETLIDKGVGESTKDSFVSVLEQCEMAKYAPLTSQNNREIYEQSIDVIEEIERVIK